jgi:hypothetical protein
VPAGWLECSDGLVKLTKTVAVCQPSDEESVQPTSEALKMTTQRRCELPWLKGGSLQLQLRRQTGFVATLLEVFVHAANMAESPWGSCWE